MGERRDDPAYRSIISAFWTGETGRELRDDPMAVLVALFLVTGPGAHATGIYTLPLEMISCYVKPPSKPPSKGAVEVTRRAMARVVKSGFAKYDEKTEIVFIPKMAEIQIGGSMNPADKRVKWVNKHISSLPKSSLVNEFLSIYSERYCLQETKGASKPPSKPPVESGSGSGSGTGVQKEQIRIPGGSSSGPRKARAPRKAPADGLTPDAVITLWDGFVDISKHAGTGGEGLLPVVPAAFRPGPIYGLISQARKVASEIGIEPRRVLEDTMLQAAKDPWCCGYKTKSSRMGLSQFAAKFLSVVGGEAAKDGTRPEWTEAGWKPKPETNGHSPSPSTAAAGTAQDMGAAKVAQEKKNREMHEANDPIPSRVANGGSVAP